ncbi:hypothetical protein BHE74_00012558, partial [Ensete ventricosum]
NDDCDGREGELQANQEIAINAYHPPWMRPVSFAGDADYMKPLVSCGRERVRRAHRWRITAGSRHVDSRRNPHLITVIEAAALMANLADDFSPLSSSSSSTSLSSSSAASLFKKPSSFLRSFSYHHRHPALKASYKRFADEPKRPKVILYSTSLRGVRRTFADCCATRAILRGFHVAVDERDVSMDVSYRCELLRLLGKDKPFSLPQVFIGNRWLGGADELRQLHDAGELGRMLEGVVAQDPAFVCGGCGGVRFLLCSTCHGSRKAFVEEEGSMRSCDACNENGLIRCPHCCS